MTSKEALMKIIKAAYSCEPCRICGKKLSKDLKDVVYAGYSNDNVTRSAHEKCWQKHKHEPYKWVHK